MKHRNFGRSGVKAVGVVAAISAFALAAFVPALASGDSAGAKASTANTVLIEGSRTKPLKFVYPKTIVEGEKLEIIDKTNPKQVGPHTFSLVEESEIPETKSARKSCFTPKHICFTIAESLGVKGEHDPPDRSLFKAGGAGWDTEGTTSKPGDTWLATKENQSFSQTVTADTSNGPTTIHFMCAVHSWMHGSIKVLPAGE